MIRRSGGTAWPTGEIVQTNRATGRLRRWRRAGSPAGGGRVSPSSADESGRPAVATRSQPGTGDVADEGRASSPRWRWTLAAAGLLTVVCAVLLPFAPVSVNEPTVRWPVDPGRPESTMLTLTAYRPLTLDVRFSCEVARLAATSGTGVVVSTTLPASAAAGGPGLVVTAADGRVQVRVLDRVLLDDPVPAGPCEYRITGRSAGLPSDVRPPQEGEGPRDLDGFARVGNAELVLTRDGGEVSRVATEQLPDVDVLATSLTSLPPGAAGDLGVELRVDDEFTNSPSPLKGGLIAVLVLALAATAGLLGWIDRSSHRAPRGPLGRPHPMDLVVPAVLVGWMFVAPMTPDDGYFGMQARNAALSDEIGNYYQAYDQSFVPFTWVYQALSGWQQLVGLGPVPQRIPALVLGVLTWLLLRWFVATGTTAVGRAVRAASPIVLGAAFLAFWLPYGMGVRPEVVVALCGVATMLALLLARRRHRLALGWLACAVAGLGFTAHTTGVTLLAPLLAGLPLLWGLVRVPGARLETATRAVAVASGGMVAALAGFADGALRDFLRGQAVFLSITDQYDWAGEATRYASLLDQFGQFGEGSFAKRAAVLACLVALAWFAVLAAAARARGTPLPAPLWLAGVSTALSFALLSLTPSKWTHHFGALAGIGSAFLGLVLVLAVPLARAVLGRARLPAGLGLAVAASFAGAIALSWHGPNSWLFSWLEGVRTPEQPPSVRNVTLDSAVLWGCAIGLVALALAVRRVRSGGSDRRTRALWAVPIVVTASLAATTGYLLVTFGYAGVRGVPPGSIWAQTVADPMGADCGPAGTVQVLDPFTAAPLPAGPLPAGPVAGFVPGAGFAPGHGAQGSVTQVWGSLASGVDGRPPVETTGEMSTGWYGLPSASTGGAAVTVTASGTLGGGNALTAVYGRRSGDVVVPLGEAPLTDTVRSLAWRTFTLAPPPAADVVRLAAADRSGHEHGWLAFTAPALASPVVLQELLPDGAPVALGWQLAFAYPCQRPPAVVNGITEPPAYALLWGDRTLAVLDDLAWRPWRGGVFGQVVRTQSMLSLATVGPVDPDLEVYAFGAPFERAAYTLTTERRTVPGAQAAVGPGGGSVPPGE